jgi:hypothetical protein
MFLFWATGSHTDASWDIHPSQLSGSERDSHIVPMSFGKHLSELLFLTPFSCTLRLDPHAVFPDTRARSPNEQSVSKNVPDRNPSVATSC